MSATIFQTSCGTYWLEWSEGYNRRGCRPLSFDEREDYLENNVIPNPPDRILNKVEEMAKEVTVSKELSTCLLISTSEFAKLTPAKQTVLIASTAGAKPVIFVENFSGMRDKKSLTDRLLKGEDVSMELEFNEIEITADDKKALEAVKPILAKIDALGHSYTWQYTGTKEDAQKHLESNGWGFYSDHVRNPGGYQMTMQQAKKIWDAASVEWLTGEKTKSFSLTVDHYARKIGVSGNAISIGCQRHTRTTVEAIAKYYGWAPNEG
jgi:hypothetical protein